MMDEQHDPEMEIWQAAVATFRERQSTLAEAFENANLVLAAYRRHRAESQGGPDIHGGPETAGSEDGADADQG
jgi:hypothetical protein